MWTRFFCAAVIYASFLLNRPAYFKPINTLWSFPSSGWSSDGGFDGTIDWPLASLKRTLWLYIPPLLPPSVWVCVSVCLCHIKPTAPRGRRPVTVHHTCPWLFICRKERKKERRLEIDWTSARKWKRKRKKTKDWLNSYHVKTKKERGIREVKEGKERRKERNEGNKQRRRKEKTNLTHIVFLSLWGQLIPLKTGAWLVSLSICSVWWL